MGRLLHEDVEPSRMKAACAPVLGRAHCRRSSGSTSAGSRFSRPAARAAGTCRTRSTAAAVASVSSRVPCTNSSKTPFSR